MNQDQGGSGAESTVDLDEVCRSWMNNIRFMNYPTHVELATHQVYGAISEIWKIKADLEAARTEIERLKAFRAAYRESEAELAQARARIESQDRVIEAARRFRLASDDDVAAQAIRQLCAALDAAQAVDTEGP